MHQDLFHRDRLVRGNHPILAPAARSAHQILKGAYDLVDLAMMHQWPVTKFVYHLSAIVAFGRWKAYADLSYPIKTE